jgi:hypothetical protein
MNKINIELNIADEGIENIVITALEGGIGYWACLDNAHPTFIRFRDKNMNLSISECVYQLLMVGGVIYFYDSDSDENETDRWELTLDMLLNGIKIYIEKSKQLYFIEDLDSIGADHIFQYAMFKELVYG